MVSYDSPDTCSSVSYVGFNRNAHKNYCRLKLAAAIAFSQGRVRPEAPKVQRIFRESIPRLPREFGRLDRLRDSGSSPRRNHACAAFDAEIRAGRGGAGGSTLCKQRRWRPLSTPKQRIAKIIARNTHPHRRDQQAAFVRTGLLACPPPVSCQERLLRTNQRSYACASRVTFDRTWVNSPSW